MPTALNTGALSLGQRPALLVVDASVGFTDPDSPLGACFDSEIAVIERLVQHARAEGWPIVFTTVSYAAEQEAAVFRRKLPALNCLTVGSALVEIDPRLTRTEDDTLLRKLHASAFHGTDLDAWLRAKTIDSLVVCGFTTSGCVRASAVDALQYGYPTVVVSDAVGDRDPAAHEANLYDLGAKYVDVRASETLFN